MISNNNCIESIQVPCIFIIIKQLLNSLFCDILDNQGLGKHYQPRPSARLMILTSILIILDITKTSSNIIVYYLFGRQGPVVWRLISTNLGLNFNPGFFSFCSKVFPQIILAILFSISNHQIVKKKKRTRTNLFLKLYIYLSSNFSPTLGFLNEFE